MPPIKKKPKKPAVPKKAAASSSNPWIRHVKKYSADHGISYKEALNKASPSYKVGKGVYKGKFKEFCKDYDNDFSDAMWDKTVKIPTVKKLNSGLFRSTDLRDLYIQKFKKTKNVSVDNYRLFWTLPSYELKIINECEGSALLNEKELIQFLDGFITGAENIGTISFGGMTRRFKKTGYDYFHKFIQNKFSHLDSSSKLDQLKGYLELKNCEDLNFGTWDKNVKIPSVQLHSGPIMLHGKIMDVYIQKKLWYHSIPKYRITYTIPSNDLKSFETCVRSTEWGWNELHNFLYTLTGPILSYKYINTSGNTTDNEVYSASRLTLSELQDYLLNDETKDTGDTGDTKDTTREGTGTTNRPDCSLQQLVENKENEKYLKNKEAYETMTSGGRTPKEYKAAYNRLAMLVHPDKLVKGICHDVPIAAQELQELRNKRSPDFI